MKLFVVTIILLECMVRVENFAHNREYLGVLVGIGSLVPPCSARELAEADKVDATAALCEEFAAPLSKHFFLVEACASVGRLEVIFELVLGIVALAHCVQELCCTTAVTAAHLALCK